MRQKAAWAILAFDDSPPLVRHMQRCLRRRHGDESLVSIDSVQALAELGDERVIPCLIDALDSENDAVLDAAVKALGTFGIECDEDTPFESLRQEWRKAKRQYGRTGIAAHLRRLGIWRPEGRAADNDERGEDRQRQA